MKSKEQKRKEAAIRQDNWNQLGTSEQIEELRWRPGKCRKQLDRLVQRELDTALEVGHILANR